MKTSLNKIPFLISQLLWIGIIFLAQHFAALHSFEHESTLSAEESCVVCLIAQDNPMGALPILPTFLMMVPLVSYVIHAYHASPFLSLHRLLAQTRAPPVFTQ